MEAYCIRPTNAHDNGQMIRPPGTRGDVCNTPLPIRTKNWIPLYPLIRPPGTRGYIFNRYIPLRIKNWIPFYSLIRPPGTRGYVFNRHIPKRDMCLFDTYLLNPIPGKDRLARKPLIQNPVRAGAYAICPYPYGSKIGWPLG